ncbi:MAG: putative flavin-dependent oxidoreductase, partial [Gammaproteobacteria bacterium]|nr:putative flavin-dependent oxidoreductase [Gammaproteobacteria bacterium]
MDEDLKQIIASAIQAPSGDNCQPWKFKVDKNQIYLINLPERDTSLYSWGQRASYVAHGAAIENISVTAIKLGYETHIELFPNKLDQNLVAKIVFDKNSTSRD